MTVTQQLVRAAVDAEVHVIRPQAGAAAGRVKGVGLELSAIIVDSRGRHVEPFESALSTILRDWFWSGTLGLK